jgi:hypothetical protein
MQTSGARKFQQNLWLEQPEVYAEDFQGVVDDEGFLEGFGGRI